MTAFINKTVNEYFPKPIVKTKSVSAKKEKAIQDLNIYLKDAIKSKERLHARKPDRQTLSI